MASQTPTIPKMMQLKMLLFLSSLQKIPSQPNPPIISTQSTPSRRPGVSYFCGGLGETKVVYRKRKSNLREKKKLKSAAILLAVEGQSFPVTEPFKKDFIRVRGFSALLISWFGALVGAKAPNHQQPGRLLGEGGISHRHKVHHLGLAKTRTSFLQPLTSDRLPGLPTTKHPKKHHIAFQPKCPPHINSQTSPSTPKAPRR